ncbi:MAG: chemotaxis protein CheA [Gammaproteobacteria bacterium]|nr:chemotaxis protein CheA [Gammaproteobacteria bacterium]
MSIDLSQFHQVFFEESFDGLEVMEQNLLGLDPKQYDPEVVNTIFRAAHSIKGGSATFHFSSVAEFTHILETLLDQMRNGQREVSAHLVDLLLQSVDCLRQMLTRLQDNQPVDRREYAELEAKLENEIGGEQTASAKVTDSNVDENIDENIEEQQDMAWFIEFIPERQILQTGNEPLRMFRELALLGEVLVVANTDELPNVAEMDETLCYSSWRIAVLADVEESAIREVFEWVSDECELVVKRESEAKVRARLASHDSTASQPTLDGQAATSSEEEVADESAEPIEDSTPTQDLTLPNQKDVQGTATSNKAAPVATSGSSIRVSIDKVDSLINLVGELVITQSMLGQMGEDFNIKKLERLREGLIQLEQNTRELQESVMQIRMLPISFIFNRFPRMIRDLSSRLSKKVELEIIGETTELDKTVMEQIGDPLVHLVRNSLDHGIEAPEVRRANGKPEQGKVSLNAFHQGGNIVIEIIDDGAGINTEKVQAKAIERGLISETAELADEDIHQLIFEPGFSTAEQISDVSGRGVGMDVVKKNIQSLGGTVEVRSEQGEGSTFTIRLPLTLAILDGQLIRVGSQIYVVPLTSIVESIQIKSNEVVSLAGNFDVYKLREDHVPILRLYETFSVKADFTDYSETVLVVVEVGGKKIGFMVDELLAQQQVVIKSLETNFIAVEGISGATILGDGKVALILDITGMLKRLNYQKSSKKGLAA